MVGRLLNYLLVPLYTRVFIPEEYGVITEMYAYAAFFVVLLTYGMETAFFRFSSKKNEFKKVYSTTLISILISSLVFILLMYLNLDSLAQATGYKGYEEYIKWLIIILSLDAISAIPFASLRYQNKAIKFAAIRLINISVNIGCNIYYIVYLKYGIEYVFISNLISSALTLILLLPEILKSTWVFDRILWKKMTLYASPLLFAGLAGMTNEMIDRILLKHLLPNPETAMSELGLYGAFYKLSIIMVLFIQTFRFAAEPFFFSQKNSKNNKRIYADVMKYFVIVVANIFLVVTIFYDFFENLIGKEFHDERGFLVVSILLLANIFLGIYYNLSVWYKLTDKTIFGAGITIFGAIITLIANIILIPKIGFVGSAWATLICYFTMTIISYFYGRRHFLIPYNTKRILIYLLSMTGIYLLIFYTNNNDLFIEIIKANNVNVMLVNSLWLVIFIVATILIEKPKNLVNSTFKEIKNENKN